MVTEKNARNRLHAIHEEPRFGDELAVIFDTPILRAGVTRQLRDIDTLVPFGTHLRVLSRK
jgi:hypothetical protein